MNFVNRISLIITPKQPMHQWVQSVSPDDAPSFEELKNESSCYLIDEPEQEVLLEELISQLVSANYQKIWNNELSVWDEYLDNVPTEMNEIEFKNWFNVTLSGLTFDLAKNPLMRASTE